jgi:PIN domain nuclease of toxin-antitoxin system
MRLLVDTHLLVWWVAGRQLPREAVTLIEDSRNELFASAASIWEIAIKAGLGRIALDPAELTEALEGGGFTPLPVTSSHAVAVATLPSIHRDPFDRLLVAQSRVEHLSLLTHDKILAEYGALVVRAT